MNYRQKSKIYGKWAFIKYRGNSAIYVVCQNCSFTYPCYEQNRNEDGSWSFTCTPGNPYKYCPRCGLKMRLFNGNEIYKSEKTI